MNYSIVIPAKNEYAGLKNLLPELLELGASEIIVVSDGSTDQTVELCHELGVRVIEHPYSKGNGASVKSGLRAASSDVVVCMDGDGQHQAADVPALLASLNEGYDMVVGARTSHSQASAARGIGNRIYNTFASWVVGHKIEDLTSGFRAVYRDKFLQFMHLLPNGFSYPTTITMSFFRAGYSIKYLPVSMPSRVGQSHLRIVRDGVKFFLIIFRVGTLYSPLKIFLPIALAHFATGIGYYSYTYITSGRFTNMSALLISSAVIIFLIGLVSEQISSLIHKA